jgi:hypothetical protein
MEEAAMLTTLLASRGADPKKDGDKSAELTRALVDALVANGTPMAQGSLVGLVDGSLPVSEDHGAAWEAALTALARMGRPDTEELIVRAIMAPEELRPSLRGPAAEELRKAALAAVRAGGSPRLRLRLAKAAIDPRYPSAVRKPVQSLLSENADENLEAMTLMFGSSTLADDVRKDTEKRLLTSGNRLIAALLRLPVAPIKDDKTKIAGETPELIPAKVAVRVAPLWKGELRAAVGRRLELLESLSLRPGLIRLAATIPDDTVRAELFDALRRNWGDGTESWTNDLFTHESFCEPGLLVSIKLLHPEQTERADQAARMKSRLTRRKPLPMAMAGAKVAKDASRLRFEWLRLQYDLVTRFCWVLNGAGQVEAGMARNQSAGGGEPSGDAEPPVPLHDGARVVSRLDLDWSRDLPAGVPADCVAPTRIKYVHIQQTTTRLMAIVAHYRHQLDAPIEHKLQDGLTLWMESCRRVPDSERRRSVDVLITRGKATHQPNDLEDKISIDILLVEVNDPSRSQSKE